LDRFGTFERAKCTSPSRATRDKLRRGEAQTAAPVTIRKAGRRASRERILSLWETDLRVKELLKLHMLRARADHIITLFNYHIIQLSHYHIIALSHYQIIALSPDYARDSDGQALFLLRYPILQLMRDQKTQQRKSCKKIEPRH
jgi:hypothetical protein